MVVRRCGLSGEWRWIECRSTHSPSLTVQVATLECTTLGANALVKTAFVLLAGRMRGKNDILVNSAEHMQAFQTKKQIARSSVLGAFFNLPFGAGAEQRLNVTSFE